MTFEIVNPDSTPQELADQINSLHAEMTGHMTMAVKKAIEIGRLLTEQKSRLAHGEWIPWVESNLTFGRNMAAKYMKVYANGERVTHLQATSLREAVALLAEPQEDSSPELTAGVDHDVIGPASTPGPEPKIIYQTDPAIEERLREAEELATETEKHLLDRNREYGELTEEHDRLTREVEELRKLKADKERVEDTLRQINELKARQAALFKDAESTKLVHQVLLRSREFFTREVMQLAALHIRPGAVDAMQQDFRGLIELVENWLEAMKERFINE